MVDYCIDYSMDETVAANGAVNAETPVKSVLKHTKPRRHSHRRPPRQRHPRPLPHLNAALWVGHHRQVSTIGRTQAGNTRWTAIGIQWILGSR